MKIYNLKDIPQSTRDAILRRAGATEERIVPEVQKIIDEVIKSGDAPIIKKYEKRTGRKIATLRVTRSEIDAAYKNIDKKLIQSIRQAARNISAVCRAQRKSLASQESTNVLEGIDVWREWRAIQEVGLYIPGGRAYYPSTVLMTAIPAALAGCRRIVMVTPPDDNFEIPAATLVAADIAGVTEIYKVGGVQAIAALAFGTESIAPVYKIVGPGNSFVTVAKTLVYPTVDIDMPAGPSEVFIIADETGSPAFIAADLLADAEHGPDSAAVLVTTSSVIAEAVKREIELQLNELTTAATIRASLSQYGLIAVCESINAAIEFANTYAPEHLEIMTKNPMSVAKKIVNAGSVFIGDYTTKSAGDYATGANHVLPTAGAARAFGALSVGSFGRLVEFQKASKAGLAKIKDTIETMATAEGLPAHRNSASIRFKD